MVSKHHGTPEIHTTRLRLRRVTRADALKVFLYARDPEVTRYLPWAPHSSPQETRAYLDTVICHYPLRHFYYWVIEYESTQEVIGAIEVVHQDFDDDWAELGWVLRRDHWGKGIMTEAVTAVVQFLLRLGYERIQAKHQVENLASGRVMEKVGFTPEGILRHQQLRPNGTYADCRMWSIVQGDRAAERLMSRAADPITYFVCS